MVSKDEWVLYFFGGCLLETAIDLRETKKTKVLESFLRSVKSTEQYFLALNLYIDITKFNGTLQ